eukprot:3595588-Amphidinium_carterae.1
MVRTFEPQTYVNAKHEGSSAVSMGPALHATLQRPHHVLVRPGHELVSLSDGKPGRNAGSCLLSA